MPVSQNGEDHRPVRKLAKKVLTPNEIMRMLSYEVAYNLEKIDAQFVASCKLILDHGQGATMGPDAILDNIHSLLEQGKRNDEDSGSPEGASETD